MSKKEDECYELRDNAKFALVELKNYEMLLERIRKQKVSFNKEIDDDIHKIRTSPLMTKADKNYEIQFQEQIRDNQNKWFDDFILNAPGKIHLLKSNYEFLHRTFIELCDLNTMKFQAKKEELTDVQLKTMDELGLRKDGRRKKKSRKKSKINL